MGGCNRFKGQIQRSNPKWNFQLDSIKTEVLIVLVFTNFQVLVKTLKRLIRKESGCHHFLAKQCSGKCFVPHRKFLAGFRPSSQELLQGTNKNYVQNVQQDFVSENIVILYLPSSVLIVLPQSVWGNFCSNTQACKLWNTIQLAMTVTDTQNKGNRSLNFRKIDLFHIWFNIG